MNSAVLLALLILAVTGLRLLLSVRQIRHVLAHRDRVPARFDATISAATHGKAADYTVAKARLNMLALVIESALALALTVGGGLETLTRILPADRLGTIPAGLALFAAVALITGVIDLPLGIYRTFVLEARFGFNRMTWRLYLQDLLRSLALLMVVGAPLAAGVLWMMDSLGAHWWLWVWLAWMAFSVLMQAVYPTWIAPLFNRFTPLADATLRERIERLMRECGFSSNGLFVMDGSRRSAHGNAYFTGFGRTKRVVFYDTLLERLGGDEIEAVLAHELGHFARRHILQRIVLIFAFSLLVLAVLGQVGNDTGLRAALRIPLGSTAALLSFFSLTLGYLLFPLQPLMSAWSRRHEFEADAYAARCANPAALISALVKLYQDNASTLTPDPWHSAIYDSHPSALARIGRLDRMLHA